MKKTTVFNNYMTLMNIIYLHMGQYMTIYKTKTNMLLYYNIL